MNENDPRYEVDDPEMKETLQNLGVLLAKNLPPNWGFGLFLFTYGPGGSMFWISSADRSDMMKALREFMQKEEGN